jgi:anthranilate/para-aminobenzoate synthase component I
LTESGLPPPEYHRVNTASWKALIEADGGWVNDSEPEAEFQETVNKSKAMLKAVALAETFAKK